MKKFMFYLVLVVIVLGAAIRISIEFESGQDTAMQQFARIAMTQAARGMPQPDSLQAVVCGSASPLGNTDRAQACIAIVTPQHLYIVDAGAGSAAKVNRAQLPMNRLQGVLLTHFHSDHIAEIYELNLASWVQGRPEPLRVFGPKGVNKVIDGINNTYEADRNYRTGHHGEDLLPPRLGKLSSTTIKSGVILEDGDLTITAYTAEHPPIEPAVGYRFDYRGRSIVVSGDSNVTEMTREIASDADLLFHDALSVPLIETMSAAATDAGQDRLARIATDVLDYHASTTSVIELGQQTDIDMIALYHLVPVPQNLVMEKVFERGLPDNFVIADDLDIFELPAGSDEINLIRP
jgi:ribonuclease Z